MCKSAGHVLKSIHLSILNPLVVSHRIDPERAPVSVSISSKLIIKLKLNSSVSTNGEVTCLLSILINASILVDSITSDVSFDPVGALLDVRRLHKFSSFVSTVASSIVVVVDAKRSVES